MQFLTRLCLIDHKKKEKLWSVKQQHVLLLPIEGPSFICTLSLWILASSILTAVFLVARLALLYSSGGLFSALFIASECLFSRWQAQFALRLQFHDSVLGFSAWAETWWGRDGLPFPHASFQTIYVWDTWFRPGSWLTHWDFEYTLASSVPRAYHQTSGHIHALSVQHRGRQDQDGCSCFLLACHFSCKNTAWVWRTILMPFLIGQFTAVVQASFGFFFYGFNSFALLFISQWTFFSVQGGGKEGGLKN